MSKKKKTIIAVIAILAIAILGLGAGVIAKYYTEFTTGEGNLTVAKWAFKADNTDSNERDVTCDITDPANVDEDTLIDGLMAPGTSGTCTFELSNENSEVGVEYTITVSSIENAPKNLILKNGTAELTDAGFKGTLTPGETGRTVTVNWEWPYETGTKDATTGIASGDDDDTTDGKNAEEMSIVFNIKGIQVRPAAQ